MKKSIYYCFLIILMNMYGIKVFAHDIAVKNADGVTIYYVWTNNNTELAVSYYGNAVGTIGNVHYSGIYSGSVTIPESVEYYGRTYNVTSIGTKAFCASERLNSITIPFSVTTIGNQAFAGCSCLTSITIPNSVTTIGGGAFAGCSCLTSITIPNSVTTIGEAAFYNCSKLSSITLPGSISSIEMGMFENCFNLTSITIPNSVTSIGDNAFYGCSSLTSVTIPNSVMSIGDYAFYKCNNLKSITIGSGVLSISNSAINTKPKKVIWLTNTPPSGYENAMGEINYVANNSYTKLNNINVYPLISSLFEVDGVKYVPVSSSDQTCDAIDCAYNNTSEKIHIGEKLSYKGVEMTVKEIKPYAFYANKDIKDVELRLAGAIGECAFKDCISIKEVTLGENVSVIEDGAFSGCSSLTSLNIPQSVTRIGNSTFQGCESLYSLTIPNSVTTIGDAAFYNCKKLKSMTIGSGVLSISNSAINTKPKKVIWFTNTPPSGYENAMGEINYVANDSYTKLNNTTVYPFISSLFEVDGVKYVPVSPSDRTCDAIDCAYNNTAERIHIGEKVSYKGVEMTVKEVKPYTCYANEYIKNVELGLAGAIGECAFKDCNPEQTSIVIPSSITRIGKDAFAGWKNLASVSINCPVVGSWFKGFTSLKEVTLGEEVLVVEDNAFEGCTGLTSLNIPQSVTSIGNSAFQGCSGLTDVVMNNKDEKELTYDGYDVTNDIETYTKRTNTWVWDNSDEKWYVLNNLSEYEPYGVYADNMNTWYEGKLAIVNEHEWEYTDGSWNDLGLVIKAYSTGENYIERNSGNIGEIDLGVPVTSETRVQIKHYPTKADGGGILWTAGIDWRIFFAGSYLHFDFKGTRKSIEKSINTLYEWEIGNYYIKDIDSSTNNIISGTPFGSFSNTGNNIIFGPSGAEDFCRLYYIKIFEGENLVKDLVPYFDGNNYGLWDKVNNIAHMPIHGTVTGNVSENIYPKYYSTRNNASVIEYPIGNNAFSGCSNLQGIEIPNDVTSIGNYAFHNCSAMSTVKISNSVKNIGSSAFNGCSAIHEIFIPKSVKTINDNVFKGCTSLNTVIMEDKESELTLGSNGSSPLFADCPLDSVYIGRNITYPTPKEKGYSPFYRNASLRSVMITDKETEISENEFYGCSNLKNVSIGDGVTTIGNWAFSGCSSLDYFAFGTNMKTIGKEAFSDCTAMTNLYSRAKIPPVCDSQALDDINKWNCNLHIPNGTISAYQQADQWKDFFFIYDDVSGIRTTVTDTSESIIVYDLNGHKKEGLQRGINIIKYSDGTVKKVMQK